MNPSNSTDGWRWSFIEPTADWGERLAPVLQRWEELERFSGAEVLKANLQRQVIALPATSSYPDLVIKRYRMVKRIDRIKTLIMASRAEREWEALKHLQAMGIDAPGPIAVGEQRPSAILRGAGLIMHRVPDAVSFPDWWEQSNGADRELALEAVGAMVGALHATGLEHADLHLGNVLMSTVHRSHPIILDLHSTQIGGSVPPRLRLANLAKLYHSLDDRLTRRQRWKLLAAYRDRLSDESRSVEELDRTLVKGAQRLEMVRLASRSRRCWKTTTDFVRERRQGWTIHRRRDFDPVDWWPLVAQPEAIEEVLKKRKNQLVGRATAGAAGKVVLKSREQPAWWRGLIDRVCGSPLERAWGAARALDVRGIPNPRALALATRTRFGIPLRTVLITADLTPSEPLHAYLQRHYLEPEASREPVGAGSTPCRRALARNVANFVREIHDRAVYHRDLNPMNILIDPKTQQLSLVDLDSIHMSRALTDRRRQKNLVQIGLLPEGHVHNRDRLRFLYAYDRNDRHLWSNAAIDHLGFNIGQETVAIIARLSRQGRGQ